jgi:hypothetical protein
MSSLPPQIFLGDLLRALAALGPLDAGTRDAIATLLGLHLAESPPESPAGPELAAPAPSVPGHLDQPAGDAGRAGARPGGPADLPDDLAADPQGTGAPTFAGRLSTWDLIAKREGPWPVEVKPLAPPIAEDVADAPPLEPLLVPAWVRGILSAALATPSPDGPLDLERLVDTVARRQPILRLPRQPLPTLRQGVQVLVDTSPAMVPFARDRAWLVAEIRRVVGEDLTQVLRFAACPGRDAGPGSRRTWEAYRPPARGTVVLLLTDLGIGHPPSFADWADEREWLQFVGTVRHAGCPLVALVPYAEARWPRELRDAIAILAWDRRTSVATVRHRVGRGHEVTS